MKKIIFLFIFLAVLLTLPPILTDNFYFGFNAGQDAFYIKDILQAQKRYLIAPWSANSAFFQGSFFYYLAAIPFALSGGCPASIIFISSLTFILTIAFGFKFFKQTFGKRRAVIFALLALFSPLLTNLAGSSGAANLIPLIALLFLITIYKA